MSNLKNVNIAVFGELLLRFSSEEPTFINKKHTASIFPGGSEANVAASLAQLKLPVQYITAIPDNALATQTLDSVKHLGADVSKTIFRGDRLGQYFLLSANGLSKGEVVYDRKYSSFSQLQPGELNWEELLKDCDWLHWTALTPALNENLAAVMLEGLKAAKEKGIQISVDLNYRSKLWNYGKLPIDIMPELTAHCHVIMGNIWAANTMLGIPVDEALDRHTSKEEFFAHATDSAKALFSQYPSCQHIAYTFRFMDSPQHNLFYGTYHTEKKHYISETFETFDLIDRIGSGDAFMAGLIFALTQNRTEQEIVDIATNAGFKKLFVKGDFGDGSI